VVVRVVGCLHVTLHGVHSRIHSLRRSSGRRPEAARACSGGAGGGGGLGLGGGLGAAGRPVAGGCWWLAAGWWLSLEPWLARSIGAGCLLRYGWMAGCWLPAVGRLHLLALLPAGSAPVSRLSLRLMSENDTVRSFKPVATHVLDEDVNQKIQLEMKEIEQVVDQFEKKTEELVRRAFSP
jgi:hypothetical protein